MEIDVYSAVIRHLLLLQKYGLTNEEIIFAFAHECAHIVNHDKLPIARPSGKGKAKIEQYADIIAKNRVGGNLCPLSHHPTCRSA